MRYYITALLLFANYIIHAGETPKPRRYLIEFNTEYAHRDIYERSKTDTVNWTYFDSIHLGNNTWEHGIRFHKPHLSNLAMMRRTNIILDEKDYGVPLGFLDSLSKYPVQIIRPSRWLCAALVLVTDTNILYKIRTLEFVKNVLYLGKLPEGNEPATFDPGNIQTKTEESENFQKTYYDKEHKRPRIQGFSFNQLNMIYDTLVDRVPYQRTNFPIAVLDAGFKNANLLPCFKHLFDQKLLQGCYDFSSNDTAVFDDDDHGTKVLSCISGYEAENFSGSAPNAKVWLFRTEESSSETLAEEVLWCMAAEFADSVGCSVISSSLGYNYFDDAEQNHTYEEMDGEHSIIAKSLKIASSKGIAVVTSSGNEGDKAWHYITTPGDSKYALTLGACDKNGEHAIFSSYGPSSDGRIKPDVVALGYETVVCSPMGYYTTANGSSFSTPIVAGFVAHLKNDFPGLADSILFEAIRFSSSAANDPNYKIGYGIPNYKMAYRLLELYTEKNYEDVYVKLNEADKREYTILNLEDHRTQKIQVKVGNRMICEINTLPETKKLFGTYYFTLPKSAKTGVIYSVRFLDQNEKVLHVSQFSVHR